MVIFVAMACAWHSYQASKTNRSDLARKVSSQRTLTAHLEKGCEPTGMVSIRELEIIVLLLYHLAYKRSIQYSSCWRRKTTLALGGGMIRECFGKLTLIVACGSGETIILVGTF